MIELKNGNHIDELCFKGLDNIASQKVLEKAGFIPTGETGEEGPRYVRL